MVVLLLGLADASAYAATYALSVSSNSNRSGAIALEGTTLAGNQYIFTSLASALTNFNPPGVKRVCFWLDNPATSGTATHCESGAPYDFVGGVNGNSTSPAKPWNTSQIANGTHTITQVVTLSAGGTETDTATFTIASAPPGLQSLSLNPGSVTGGQSSTATLTLTGAAPAGGAVVNVSSDSNSAQVPVGGTVTVPAGNTSTTFQVTTSTVNSVTQATISANYSGVTKTAILTINPPGSATYALSVSTQSNRSGGIALNGATLAGNAYVFTSLAAQLTNFNPTGITQVCFWLDNTAMSGAATHCESAVPYDYAGSASTTVANPWNTTAVANGTHTITQQVTLSAGGTEVDTATFTLSNGTTTPTLQSLSLNLTTVSGGQASTATVTLTSAAPAGGAVVAVSSNDPAAQVPAIGTVTVPAGSTSTTFQVTTSSVNSVTQATITATYNNGTKTAVLTINPLGAATYALSVSTQSNRSGGIALNGATLAGNAYVFTSLAAQLTNFNPTGITQVCFWLDNTAMSGTATHCEAAVPYDYAGSASTTVANPWNTTAVANGTHTITQQVTKSAGGTEVVTATFTVQNGTQSSSVYALSVSASADHSGGVALQGARVSGNVYVFTSPASQLTNYNPDGVANVCFWLDNTAMSGTPIQCDSYSPYDYLGSESNSSTALGLPWDTAQVADGAHSITQQVTKSAGGTEVDTAFFRIRNVAATLSANPTNIAPEQSTVLSWTTTGATSASIDQGIGSVPLSGTMNVTPAATTTYTLTATGTGGSFKYSVTVFVSAATQHYLYVVPDQNLYVYDLDNNFQEIKHINLPQVQGAKGIGAAPNSRLLYIAYGSNGMVCHYPPCTLSPSSAAALLAYDLLTDTVKWTKPLSFAIDSFAITPDGTTIYIPGGEHSGDGYWYVLDASNGNTITTINTGTDGPHNTVVSLDGTAVFMAPAFSPYLVKADTATNTVALNIGPTLSGNSSGVRPFTINGKNTLAYTTSRNYLGFQVSNANTGAVLYTVPVTGFSNTGSSSIPSHGISLSPDETRLYLIDNSNAYVHVFDVSRVPAAAPTQIADIALSRTLTGYVSPCLYDCWREGWLNHSTDGHYVFVGNVGDVIDTSTNTLVNVPTALRDPLSNTKLFLEIDWQNGVPVFTTTRYGLGYVTQ